MSDNTSFLKNKLNIKVNEINKHLADILWTPTWGFIKTTERQPTDHLPTDSPTGRHQLTLKQKTRF